MLRTILVSALLALSCTAAQTQGAGAFAGTIKDVVGSVQLRRASTDQVARSSMKVLVNDEILTGKDGRVGVVLVDGTRLSIGPNCQTRMSEVVFDGTTQSGNILIKLYRGSLRMITGLIAQQNANAVKVVTPTSVVGVRGTDFIVQVAE